MRPDSQEMSGVGTASSLHSPPLLSPQVIMKVDVVYEKEMVYLYMLSSIGGLLLLLLIFLALYKVGASARNGHPARLGRVELAGVREQNTKMRGL